MSDTTPGPLPVISEKTNLRVSIPNAVSIAISLIGATVWMTKVYTKIDDTQGAVVEMRTEMKEWRSSMNARLDALERAARLASSSTTDGFRTTP